MDSKKTTDETDHQGTDPADHNTLKSKKTRTDNAPMDKQTPDKLMALNANSSTGDFNTRLHEIEIELHKKSKHLDSNLHQIEQQHQAQLNVVYEEFGTRVTGLNTSITSLNDQHGVLQKTNISLRKQSHELQRSVERLNKQNEQIEDKLDQLSLQNESNVRSERYHFRTMTMVLSIVAILTVLGLIYSLIHQQSLWQFSMDNGLVIERRMDTQLSEHGIQMTLVKQNLLQAEQHRNQLINNIDVLQTQLKSELKNIDENVQFLNTSVGSLRDYSRNTGKQILHDANWLTQQPASHYVIQLISVNSKQKLYQYIEEYGYSLQDDLAWFTIRSQDKDFYILTYGRYKALVQARAALSRLPSFLVAKSPGIAQLKDIHSFIQ